MTRPMLLASEDSISTNKCSCLGTAVSKVFCKGANDRLDMLVSDFVRYLVLRLKGVVKCNKYLTPFNPLSAQMQRKILYLRTRDNFRPAYFDK